MYRRTFVGVTAVGLGGLAGCAGRGGSDTGEAQSGQPGASSGPDTTAPPEQEFADAAGALAGTPVRSSGTGRGLSNRLTALGGPVRVSLSFDYTGMTNSNFVVRAADAAGEEVFPPVFAVNEVFQEPRLGDDPGIYRLRFVTRFEPGDYFLDVTHAGGPYGDGDWEAVVEQPGVPTSGASVPLTVEGFDGDVVGPVRFDGPARVTVETSAPQLGATGDPAVYNYRVVPTDATGEAGPRLLNSVETAPLTQSAVHFPESEVGYFNVHSWGPWTATVEVV
jgi:hypothetical protein